MYEGGLDEQLICEKTGHRSIAVRSYKRTSNRQMKQVSDVLYGNVKNDDVGSCIGSKSTQVKVDADEHPSKVKCETKVENKENVISLGIPPNQSCESSHKVSLPNGIVLNINVNLTK